MKKVLVLTTALTLFASVAAFTACTSGDGVLTSARPQLNPIEYDIKQLHFSWPPFAAADYYRLLENPDGISGYAPIATDLTTTFYHHPVAVHLQDWDNASYLLQGCTNNDECIDSLPRSASDSVAAIGYLKATDSAPGDRFGHAVAVSGDARVVAVGAPQALDADGTNRSGAVYIFERSEALGWTPQPILRATDGEDGDAFGHAVALSGDGLTLAVGAPQASANGNRTGAVYLFVRDEILGWTPLAILRATDGEDDDALGHAVALSSDGQTLAVGAPGENSGDTDSGAVYTFTRDDTRDTGWSEPTILKADPAVANAAFGQALALNDAGTLLAVGAPQEPVGTNLQQGAAYLFTLDTPSQPATHLSASDGQSGDRFGTALALSGDGLTLAVGAEQADSDAEPDAGAVYLFAWQDNDWQGHPRLQPDPPYQGSGDRFGNSLALGGEGESLVLVVGAVREDGAASGVGGDPAAGFAGDAGAGYLFTRDPLSGQWSQRAYLKASNTGAGDAFGQALALSRDGRTLAVGAPREDSAATGIGGEQDDDTLPDSGAVYLY